MAQFWFRDWSVNCWPKWPFTWLTFTCVCVQIFPQSRYLIPFVRTTNKCISVCPSFFYHVRVYVVARVAEIAYPSLSHATIGQNINPNITNRCWPRSPNWVSIKSHGYGIVHSYLFWVHASGCCRRDWNSIIRLEVFSVCALSVSKILSENTYQD